MPKTATGKPKGRPRTPERLRAEIITIALSAFFQHWSPTDCARLASRLANAVGTADFPQMQRDRRGPDKASISFGTTEAGHAEIDRYLQKRLSGTHSNQRENDKKGYSLDEAAHVREGGLRVMTILGAKRYADAIAVSRQLQGQLWPESVVTKLLYFAGSLRARDLASYLQISPSALNELQNSLAGPAQSVPS